MTARWLARMAVPLAVAAQFAVLAWIAGEREWIVRYGTVVHLRTAPVDPRDLFRGDYVQLRYEINDVALASREAPAPAGEPRRHEVVYTRLRPAGEGVFAAAGSSTERPDGGLFIRGRSDDPWRVGAWGIGTGTYVAYGIERYFVEQGRGRDIEDRRGTRGGLQIPMEVEVAIGASGSAVIRGHRWSRLGIRLQVLRQPAPRPGPGPGAAAPPAEGPLLPASPKLRITLVNASQGPLVLADPGGPCAVRLVEVPTGAPGAPLGMPPCDAATATAHRLRLAPGDEVAVEIDLAEPRWHVLKDGRPVEVGALPDWPRFRIEYHAPRDATADPTVWQGRLASPAFNASGRVD